jgi:DNA-binding LacI/PurR family transcriptional regulator
MATTIKQVARFAGVSTATVSYVLNGTGSVSPETRQRVLDAVAKLDYQPSHAARSMRGRSHTLGLALQALPQRLTEPALAELLAGFTDAAAERGYHLLLATPPATQTEAEFCLGLARTGRVDGLLLLDPQVDDERARLLENAQVPFVSAGPAPRGSDSPSVALNGHAAAALATKHLLAQGHRQIGLIQLPSELSESEPRYQGYADTLNQAGIPLDPELIVEAGRSEEDGYLAMNALLELPERPTAVLACSDELAFGAMHAIYDAHLQVGRDISLVGFDDLPLAAHSHPPLTSLRQPRRKMGALLAHKLIAVIEQQTLPSAHSLLDARLIVRRTTGPNNAV